MLQKNKVSSEWSGVVWSVVVAGRAGGRGGHRAVSHSDPRPAQLVTAAGLEWTSHPALRPQTCQYREERTELRSRANKMNLSADTTRAEERQNLSLVLLQQMYQPLTGEKTATQWDIKHQ